MTNGEARLAVRWRSIAATLDHGVRKRTLLDCADELEALTVGDSRNLTARQKAVEEAAGMGIDWGMANAATVAPVQADVGAGEPEQLEGFNVSAGFCGGLRDGILKRIALRYKNCMVNIYPDLPELTPVEGVLRCAAEEGFVLAARPDVAGGGLRASEREQVTKYVSGCCQHGPVNANGLQWLYAYFDGKLAAESPALVSGGRLTGGKCIEALASRREIGEGRLLDWLSEKVQEGKGTLVFSMTEEGHIGLFIGDSGTALGIGASALEALENAQARAALAGERAGEHGDK